MLEALDGRSGQPRPRAGARWSTSQRATHYGVCDPARLGPLPALWAQVLGADDVARLDDLFARLIWAKDGDNDALDRYAQRVPRDHRPSPTPTANAGGQGDGGEASQASAARAAATAAGADEPGADADRRQRADDGESTAGGEQRVSPHRWATRSSRRCATSARASSSS